MSVIAIILTILAAPVALEWIIRNLLALRVWKNTFHLEADYSSGASDMDTPLLSVVVAARNESANIETCLESLLDQDYPNFELIVCNDRSSDDTGSKIAAIAAADSRVRQIDITELPDGWCGKNHAMHKGISTAGGKWICMTDADCRQDSKHTLSAAMRYVQQNSTDMLSIIPTLQMRGFWENLLQPICGGVLMVWFPPAKVNNPAKPHAYANGMFMLINRPAYEAIGTHEAIRSSLIEDMDLARRIKSSGLNLRVLPSHGLLSVRMYTSLREIYRGWARIFFGVFNTLPKLLAAGLVLITKGLTSYIVAAVGLGMYAAGADGYLVCGSIALVGALAQTIMIVRFFKHVGSKPAMGLLYPLGCSMVAAIIIKATLMLLPGAKIVWRDTSYAAEQSDGKTT